MELCRRFGRLILGFSILLSSRFPLHECRKLDGYTFPVYSTKRCPRNEADWNARSSAINCTESNGYVCLPNENLTELLEFCYTHPFILIEEDICLYLSNRYSAVDSYTCTGFLFGCPNTSHPSYKLFEYPQCTSIGNGCFLAEPSCEGNQHDAGEHSAQNNKKMWALFGVTFGVSIIFFSGIVCCLFITHKKGNRNCIRNKNAEKYEDGQSLHLIADNQPDKIESCVQGNIIYMRNKDVEKNDDGPPLPSIPQNQPEIIEYCAKESPLDQEIIKQWQEDVKQFVETNASREVDRLAKSQNILVVTGHKGCGKSAIVHQVALKYRGQGWNVKPVRTVIDIIDILHSSTFDLEDKNFFVLNDPIGKDTFDEIEYTTWRKYEETLIVCLKKVKLLMSCRKHILNDDKVKGILKHESNIVDISNGQLKLSEKEKKEIWNKYAVNENISEGELEKILRTDAYFPLLCKLCSSKIMKEQDKVRFFTEPVDVLEEEIKIFQNSFKEKYCALVLLVLFNNDLCIMDIHESAISTEKYNLALKLCGMKKNTVPHTIDNALETLQGFFVKQSNDTYQFYQDFVMEVTTYVFGKHNPTQILKYADLSFLRKRVALKCCNDNCDQFTIYLSDKYISNLGKRLFNDIFGERLLEVVLNPCLREEKVIRIFINELKHHPEKINLLLVKKKLQIDTYDINKTSNHFFLSKLAFVSIEEKISPLSAIIIFCDTRLSLHCLKTLKEMPELFIGNAIFSSLCCNGSKDIFDMFIKDHIKESLAEKWKFLYPIHIASAFNNNEILRELLQNGADINLKTTNENFWTPLTLAAGNLTEENEEKTSTKSKHIGTVELLLREGANIDLCKGDGASPLYIACQEGHENIVQLLLRNGADINHCTKNGASPLTVACQEGHENIAEVLLKNGADFQSSTEDGSNPFFIACQRGNENTVKLLLQKGVDANQCIHDGTCPLYTACQEGYDTIVQLLLNSSADVNLCKTDGTSPLFIACQKGYESIVKHLLGKGASYNLCDKNGSSPLHAACQIGCSVSALDLLEFGANVNLCNKDGASPLYIACQEGHEIVVRFLLNKGADTNISKRNGDSPLFIACQKGHNDIVQQLLIEGAKIDLRAADGSTPLIVACQYKHENIVKCLLENGADVNLRAENGSNPLITASQYGHDFIVQLLLSKGPDINSCNKYGESPLYLACQNGYDSIVQNLLDKGTDTNLCDDASLISPFDLACQHGHEDIVNLLLRYGAKINRCRKNGDSPLYIACLEGHYNVVRLLLSNGADINLYNKFGASPLYIACKQGYESIVHILQSEGADVNLCDIYGASPLYIACEHGHDSVVRILVSEGANVNLCKKNGQSPLHIACKNKFESIVDLLVSNGADVNSSK